MEEAFLEEFNIKPHYTKIGESYILTTEVPLSFLLDITFELSKLGFIFVYTSEILIVKHYKRDICLIFAYSTKKDAYMKAILTIREYNNIDEIVRKLDVSRTN